MSADVRAWLEKADGDFYTMRRELRARSNPNYDSACFHAQQCAEKYLKGALVHERICFPKIHDLQSLLELLLPKHPDLELIRLAANRLTQYAVFFRYPGRSANRKRAREALDCCLLIRNHIRVLLGQRIVPKSRRTKHTTKVRS